MNQPSSRRSRLIVAARALALVLLSTSSALAFYLPSFYLDRNAWSATDILVVSEGDELDGRVRVLEVWAGDAKVGAEIVVPGLELFARPDLRVIHERNGPTERHVSGQRIVVYLRKTDGVLLPVDRSVIGGIGVSAAWIERDTVYVRSQRRRSGPQKFGPSGDEPALRKRTLEVTRWRKRLDEARAEKRPGERLALLAAVARADVTDAVQEAVAEIDRVEDRALVDSTLTLLLNDASTHSAAALFTANTLVTRLQAGALPLVVAALEEEIRFWRRSEDPEAAAGATAGERAAPVASPHDRCQRGQYLLEVIGANGPIETVDIVERYGEAVAGTKALSGYHRVVEGLVKRTRERIERNAKKAAETAPEPTE